jgi:multiple sugar transport system substrate-binding protein
MATRLTRREMLKLSGTLVAGGLLASCQPTPAPTEAPPEETEAPPEETEAPTEAPPPAPEGNVRIMHMRHELTEDEEAQFEADHPGITIELLNVDQTRFFAMYAAGDPPDIYRCGYSTVPEFLARDMLYDLTPYFEASDVMAYPDNLASACFLYAANSPLNVGSGPIYGMPKDWSPDSTIFVYKTAFENAGLDLPAEVAPMTYAEVSAAAEQVAVFEGDRTAMFAWTTLGVPDQIVESAMELGKDIYADSYTRANLQDEDISAIIRWWFDMQADLLMESDLNPAPSGWLGSDFIRGVVAMAQYGYWYMGWMAGQEPEIDVESEVMMITAPTWTGDVHIDTPVATGAIVAAATKIPDATWEVFQWYHAEEPAIARAEAGWGVPALKSMYELLPNETAYEQQIYNVLQNDLALDTPPIQVNPFAPGAFGAALGRYSSEALMGDITFDEMIANMEADINEAVQEGIERLS